MFINRRLIMRKHILATTLLCLCALARGQGAYEYIYWTDGNVDNRTTVMSASSNEHLQIDVSALCNGFHTLHFQIKDKDGVVSPTVTRIFYSDRKNETPDGWYQIDAQGERCGVAQVSGMHSVDVTDLSDGMHSIRFEVKDVDGKISSSAVGYFIKLPVSGQDMSYTCVYDKDSTTTVSGAYTPDVIWLDATGLSDGLHRIDVVVTSASSTTYPQSHYFVKIPVSGQNMSYTCIYDKDSTTTVSGVYTPNIVWLDVTKLADGLHTMDVVVSSVSSTTYPSTHRFIKVPQTEGVDYLNCVCYIDDVMHYQEKVEPDQKIVEWDIDMSDVERGLHNIEIQVVSPSGAASLLHKSLFLRTLTDDEMTSLDCYCIIDSVQTCIVKGVYEAHGYNFELDVDNLEDGEHTMTYLLLDNTGIVTDARTATFVKESNATGIGNIELEEKETIIYDISGRRVHSIVSSGVYIINGKKVMINKKPEM